MAMYTVCVRRGKRSSFEVQKLIEKALREVGLGEGLEVHSDKYNVDENGEDVPESVRPRCT